MIKIKITRKIAVPPIQGCGCGDSNMKEVDKIISDEKKGKGCCSACNAHIKDPFNK